MRRYAFDRLDWSVFIFYQQSLRLSWVSPLHIQGVNVTGDGFDRASLSLLFFRKLPLPTCQQSVPEARDVHMPGSPSELPANLPEIDVLYPDKQPKTRAAWRVPPLRFPVASPDIRYLHTYILSYYIVLAELSPRVVKDCSPAGCSCSIQAS